jgi:hypothetical protein
MNDIGAAFDKLDRLLAAAQDAGPSIALLMEAGRQQGVGRPDDNAPATAAQHHGFEMVLEVVA